MSARDWRPYQAVDFLRQAREACTSTAELELVAAALQTAVAEIETLRSLAEDDPIRGEHLKHAIERMAWAAEHLARRAAVEVDGDEIPF